MNPALAGKDMGWSPGGKEERRYLHLTQEEVMAERLRLTNAQPESFRHHFFLGEVEVPALYLPPRVPTQVRVRV